MSGEERTRDGVPFFAGAPPAWTGAQESALYLLGTRSAPPRSAPISIRSQIISVRVGAQSNLSLVGRAKTVPCLEPSRSNGQEQVSSVGESGPPDPLTPSSFRCPRVPGLLCLLLYSSSPLLFTQGGGPCARPESFPAPLSAMQTDEPGCSQRRERLAARLKLGSLLSRQLADRLSPLAGRSGTSAPGAPGWGGRRWPGRRRSRPSVEAAAPLQTTGSRTSARDVGSFCAVHGASGPGRPP
ncbi:hypothetical protein NDU88_002237 [Pleurodeles waltl]|uniref:Uncharacterized protein n=1 Tax=Pleurodeles waltl TaxID=8319 RepID=A0AAV7SD67_PLEWA|nr:hypothetical protein NDU88_002237 [Pleurodeles waltl]